MTAPGANPPRRAGGGTTSRAGKKRGVKVSDISAIIAGAKRPERTIELCLRADLVAELEDAQRQLVAERDRERSSLSDGGQAEELRAKVDRIKAEAADHTVVFRFRAMNHYEIQALIRDLPPRDGVPSDKSLGFNSDALTWHLFRRCCYEPELSDDDTAALIGPVDEVGNGVLSPSQWKRLDETLDSLHFAARDIPF